MLTQKRQPNLESMLTMADAHSQSAPGEFARPPLTKIVATIGPASSEPAVVKRLIEAGVAVFRLNFGHGTHEDHAQRLGVIRAISLELGRPVAAMGDIQGPKIRVGRIPNGGVELATGSTVIFHRAEKCAALPHAPVRLWSNYPRLIDDVEVGQRLLINDGDVRTLITVKRKDEIECTVTTGGRVTSNKGINLPDTRISAKTLDDDDWADVTWAIANDLDFLALSFVRSAADVHELRQGVEQLLATMPRKEIESELGLDQAEIFGDRLSRCKSPLRIIAKIEVPQAVQNIDSILEAADGIMVARGDLGVEMDAARVPVIQKQLLAAADRYGKPCIVATQMLESMIHSSTPTRAEANDVACAIMDGADAVMLSGETAVGQYPALAVESMRRIAHFTEAYLAQLPQEPSPPQKLLESRYRTAALAHGVWTIAQDIGARFVVVWSQLGGGARLLSQNSFTVPIIAITSDDRAARQMQLLRGVTPLRMPVPEDLAHFTRIVDMYLTETGWAKQGDVCVLMAGMPIGKSGVTNSVAIHAIGDSATGFHQHGRRH